MSNQIQWTLGECFAQEPLAGVVNKKVFGGYEISGWNVMVARIWVFTKGAILGEAKSDRKKPLAQLLGFQEGKEDENWTILKKETDANLEDYGEEPVIFFDYVQNTFFPNTDMGNVKTLKRLHDKKYRLGEVLPLFHGDVISGTGFGVCYPKLVQKMWIQSYETEKDPESWAEARRYGLDIPEKQTLVSLAQMEEEVLQEVKAFLEEFNPHLIEPLGLQ